jgi:hypothetical protein
MGRYSCTSFTKPSGLTSKTWKRALSLPPKQVTRTIIYYRINVNSDICANDVGVTYAQLVDKLAAMGVEESEPNVRNNLARGKFSAAFLVQ